MLYEVITVGKHLFEGTRVTVQRDSGGDVYFEADGRVFMSEPDGRHRFLQCFAQAESTSSSAGLVHRHLLEIIDQPRRSLQGALRQGSGLCDIVQHRIEL